jgi:hypothetical protein
MKNFHLAEIFSLLSLGFNNFAPTIRIDAISAIRIVMSIEKAVRVIGLPDNCIHPNIPIIVNNNNPPISEIIFQLIEIFSAFSRRHSGFKNFIPTIRIDAISAIRIVISIENPIGVIGLLDNCIHPKNPIVVNNAKLPISKNIFQLNDIFSASSLRHSGFNNFVPTIRIDAISEIRIVMSIEKAVKVIGLPDNCIHPKIPIIVNNNKPPISEIIFQLIKTFSVFTSRHSGFNSFVPTIRIEAISAIRIVISKEKPIGGNTIPDNCTHPIIPIIVKNTKPPIRAKDFQLNQIFFVVTSRQSGFKNRMRTIEIDDISTIKINKRME